ncbi:MAG: FkbM family methyltransferase [Ferruginibacter sp.]
MREFLFLSKEVGLYSAFIYLIHKLELKIINTSVVKSRNIKKQKRIENIHAALSIFNGDVVTIDSKKYIKKYLQFKPAYYIYLRPYSSDELVFSQVFIHEEYKAVVNIYDQFYTKPPELIIDCGSNIGLASIYFFMFYPEVNVIAVEPFKKNADLIRQNFDSVSLKKYKIVEAGIWNSNGWLSVDREFRDKKEWSVRLIQSGKDKKDIRSCSLLEMIEGCKGLVDILKIDIEGAEQQLFEDENYAASFLKKVKCLALEIHDEFKGRNNIYKILKNNNFFFYNTNEITVAINRSFLPQL